MTRSPGTCPLCGGEKRRGQAPFAVDLTFGVAVVRNVPALVCGECGDASIGDTVAATLEEVVTNARRNGRAIAVSDWGQVAVQPPRGERPRYYL